MERMDRDQWSARDVARLLALLEDQRRYYQDIVAALPVAVAALDGNRSIASCNRAFRQLVGMRTEDLRGKTIEQVMPSDVLIEKIRDLTVNGVVQPAFDIPFHQKILQVSITALRDGDDEIGILLVAAGSGPERGISHGSPAFSAERAQLEQQRITAQRNLALRGLSGRLAHDLNNPLMIVTGYAEELLQGFKADDPRRADVEQILEATQRISGVTAQLLQFTRKQANAPQPVDLSAVLSGLKDKIGRAAGKGVRVEIPQGAAVWASCEQEQIEEIVLALASAGREGAQERTRLQVACDTAAITEALEESTLQPGTYARITVRDNGQGIPADRRNALFEAVVVKEPGQAAFARVYAIVNEWGGDIAVHSEPSRGSAFEIYLPLAKAGGQPGKDRRSAASPAGTTILVVDDEPGIRGLVAKILRREKYQVIEARGADEAVTAALNHGAPVQMLVTDVMMPGRSGRELADQFRETIPGLKVLYMSGHTGAESLRPGALPPGSRFLQKPFTLDALVSTVRELLSS